MKNTIIILSVLASCTFSAKLPAEAKKCIRTDEHFSECITEAVQQMVSSLTTPNREIGLVSLEPLEIPSLVIGAGTGAVLLSQNYTNVKLHNYSKGKILKFDIDFEKKTAFFNATFDELIWDAHYAANGKILLLPVFGDGPCKIQLLKCYAYETFELEEVMKKGKKHLRVVSSKLQLNPERVIFRFDNLFNGDKALGENINTVLNDNWREVADDVIDAYADAIAQINSGLWNSVLNKFSIADLFE